MLLLSKSLLLEAINSLLREEISNSFDSAELLSRNTIKQIPPSSKQATIATITKTIIKRLLSLLLFVESSEMNCGVVDIVADAFDCEGDDSDDAGSNSNVTSSLVFVAVNVFERVEDFEF